MSLLHAPLHLLTRELESRTRCFWAIAMPTTSRLGLEWSLRPTPKKRQAKGEIEGLRYGPSPPHTLLILGTQVGVFAQRGESLSTLTVVEYSELDPAVATAPDPDTPGCLMYNWGNICMHYFSTAWLQRVGACA